ncbi:MAG: pseudouridine synthase [Phycisphaerales bacterium]
MSDQGGHPQDVTPNLDDASRGVRIQKALAAAGVGSRRACERLIEDGAVAVNGAIVTDLPAWVDPESDEITVSGRILPRPERRIYILLYKPRNTVCTVDDPSGRRTVLDIVEHPSGVRLYPVGRLDYDTMGLLLLTNDGPLANQLTHPRFGVSKTYRAIVKGRLEDEDVRRLAKGVHLAERREGRTVGGKRTTGVDLRIVRREPERTIIDITLSEGRNRQVRRMLATVGCNVKKLVRTEMGPLRLKGLRLGEWRELTSGEIRSLRNAARSGKNAARKQGGEGRERGRGSGRERRSRRRP